MLGNPIDPVSELSAYLQECQVPFRADELARTVQANHPLHIEVLREVRNGNTQQLDAWHHDGIQFNLYRELNIILALIYEHTGVVQFLIRTNQTTPSEVFHVAKMRTTISSHYTRQLVKLDKQLIPDDAVVTCVSGYFDPLHVGHLEYFKRAKSLGTVLMVIVNNDHQARLKKKKPFMPQEERVQIIKALACADIVVLSTDEDRTVRKTLSEVVPRPALFCNGGDQNNHTIPERATCRELGIRLVDNLGGKIQSSSWLIEHAAAGREN
jgi:cytidyltransferase-like protein